MHIFQKLTVWLLKAWLLLSFSLLFISEVNAEQAILIHHPELQNEDFSKQSLVRIYAMKKRYWSDGTPVTVFTLASDNNTHKSFVTHYLRMQPYQLKRLWHRLVFSGTGSIPQEVSSKDIMLEKVKSTPGAIGYIDHSQIKNISETMLPGGIINE